MFAAKSQLLKLNSIIVYGVLVSCAGQATQDVSPADSTMVVANTEPSATRPNASETAIDTGLSSSGVVPNPIANNSQPVENLSVSTTSVDQDRDGIPDSEDQCKDTPAAATVNSRGCPLDTDGDKVADYIDACQGTPVGIEVDKRGCGFDDDFDGVPDWRDSCGGSPPYVAIGGNGCELDSDADGVVDSRDQCAGTPPGLKVEPMGCHLTDLLVLRGANFQSGSHRLSNSAQRILHDLAATLKRHPRMRVSIAGHTDDQGSAALNKDLSERRAQSAKAFLINLGVSPAALSVSGLAGESPVASNDNEAGRAQNRRVEMRIVEID